MDTVTFKGNVMHLEGTQPAVGGKAPDFTLTANDMSPRSLKDYAGKVLVLVCVPSLDTPVCDMEVRRFNTEAAALSDKVRIVAVSRDLPFAQARWCGAAGVTAVEALSDYRAGAFGKAYGICWPARSLWSPPTAPWLTASLWAKLPTSLTTPPLWKRSKSWPSSYKLPKSQNAFPN